MVSKRVSNKKTRCKVYYNLQVDSFGSFVCNDTFYKDEILHVNRERISPN